MTGAPGSQLKRVARNAKLRTLAVTLGFTAGGVILAAGYLLGFEIWISALVATVGATIVNRVIDAQIR